MIPKDIDQNGILLISLDFEMFWGIADISDYREKKTLIENVYKVVPRILELFEKYGIHATWATVGALMCETKKEFFDAIPTPFAPQTERLLLKLGLVNDQSPMSCPDTMLFAPQLVEMVSSTIGQEIGTHTFSHFYCDDSSSDPTQFAAELKAAATISNTKGYGFCSAVFPRNQVSEPYTKEIDKSTIKCYRGVERGWIAKLKKKWEPLGVLFWYIDNYIPLQRTCSYKPSEAIQGEKAINLYNSRFFKPFRPKYKYAETLKIWRYKREMKHAAKNGEIYHIYWHPHNFAENSDINFEQIDKLLSFYTLLRDEYGMKTMNMREVCHEIDVILRRDVREGA